MATGSKTALYNVDMSSGDAYIRCCGKVIYSASETNPDVHDNICVKVAEESRTVPWRRIFILSWINLMSKRYQNIKINKMQHECS